jgi:DNA-3-methyladenine glycosylase I
MQISAMEPVHNDRELFEILCLEAAAAGLNRKMIEKKKENYRKAFDNFETRKVAKYDHRDFDRLMNDTGIIRNRAKISAFIKNSQAFLKIQEEYGSFDKYIWSFVNDKPINFNEKNKKIPEKMSKELKKKGFQFTGPTTMATFMFHTGMLRWVGEHCPWK